MATFTPIVQLDDAAAAPVLAAARAADIDPSSSPRWWNRLGILDGAPAIMIRRPRDLPEECRDAPWIADGPSRGGAWNDFDPEYHSIAEGVRRLRAGAERELERRERLITEHHAAVERERARAAERAREQESAREARAARDRELDLDRWDRLPDSAKLLHRLGIMFAGREPAIARELHALADDLERRARSGKNPTPPIPFPDCEWRR